MVIKVKTIIGYFSTLCCCLIVLIFNFHNYMFALASIASGSDSLVFVVLRISYFNLCYPNFLYHFMLHWFLVYLYQVH
jgi:hypothetical protein